MQDMTELINHPVAVHADIGLPEKPYHLPPRDLPSFSCIICIQLASATFFKRQSFVLQIFIRFIFVNTSQIVRREDLACSSSAKKTILALTLASNMANLPYDV